MIKRAALFSLCLSAACSPTVPTSTAVTTPAAVTVQSRASAGSLPVQFATSRKMRKSGVPQSLRRAREAVQGVNLSIFQESGWRLATLRDLEVQVRHVNYDGHDFAHIKPSQYAFFFSNPRIDFETEIMPVISRMTACRTPQSRPGRYLKGETVIELDC